MKSVCVMYEYVRYQKVLKEEHEKTFIPDFHKKSHLKKTNSK